jgi:HEAT repeat protein
MWRRRITPKQAVQAFIAEWKRVDPMVWDHVRPLLIEMLKDDPERTVMDCLIDLLECWDWTTQIQAKQALEQIGPPAVPTMVRRCHQGSYSLRSRLVAIFEQIGGDAVIVPLITLLDDCDQSIQRKAASALQRMGALAIDPLLQALGSEQTAVRHHAICLLANIGAPAFIPLLQILDSDNAVLREHARHALDRMRPPATDILVKFVREEGPSLPYAAIDVLVNASERQTLHNTFTPLLQTHTPLAVRVKAVEVLTAARIPPERDVFVQLLHKGTPVIRQKIIFLLGKVGSSSLPIICDALWDGEAAVRETALDVLNQIGDSSTIAHIMALRNDWNATIQQKVMATLIHVCGAIEVVWFGVAEQALSVNLRTCWVNPDVSTLDVSLPALKRLEIDTTTYSLPAVERFLTYALEHLGPKFLKQQISVHVHGNPEDLHANLRNNFTHYCKQVVTHSVRSATPEDRNVGNLQKGIITKKEADVWSAS